MVIKIEKGDITEFEVDAIVNPANNRLFMGGGVAGAIKRKGGEEIEKEAVLQGPIEIGDAITTGAGKLKASYVIHTATMGMDFETDEEKIKKATRSALQKAGELGIKSVAFPALGTGVGSFPAERAARVMKEEMEDFKDKTSSLKEIIIVLFDESTYKVFKEVFEK